MIIVLFGCDRKEIIMKKILILFITMVLISGCSMNNKEVDGVDNAAAPNVMINNRLYHTTGELYDGRPFYEANENDRNQQYKVDGVITSTVEGYVLPEKIINLILAMTVNIILSMMKLYLLRLKTCGLGLSVLSKNT